MTKFVIVQFGGRYVCQLILQIIVITTTIQTVYGGNIEIYKEPNFEDLVLDSHGENDTCYSAKLEHDILKQSIWTDSCIIIYNGDECHGFSSKIFPPGNTNLTKLDLEANNLLLKFRNFESYSFCNDDEMKIESEIRVDFYDRSSTPLVLGTIFNLTGCQNLPPSVPSTGISITNNDHPIKVYTEANCTGDSKYVPAGHNWFSYFSDRFCVGSCEKFGFTMKTVKSISPFHPTNLLVPTFPRVQLSSLTFGYFGIFCGGMVTGALLIGFCWCIYKYFQGKPRAPFKAMNVVYRI